MRPTISYITFFLFITMSAFGCTGIRMSAKDGTSVNGRTVEFGTPLDMSACVVPRNHIFYGKTPLGNGLRYTSKYAAVGIYCFDEQVIMDGLNEKGLACGAFFFPGYAKYTPVNTSNKARALSPIEFSHWILTQFSSIEEVKAALPGIIIAPTITKQWGNTPPPFHYIVYDREGRSLVIEPIDGTLAVHENSIGAFTNSPTFDWHLTNLRNFINLTSFNVPPITIRNVDLAPFGQGSGMVGLPGDFTPPSRFVRAAIFSSVATPMTTGDGLVAQTFHILNQFDIPYGAVRQKAGSELHTDYTLLTSVKDPERLRYYFKSYDDQTIKWISLSDFDLNAKTIKSASTKGAKTTFNVSDSLK